MLINMQMVVSDVTHGSYQINYMNFMTYLPYNLNILTIPHKSTPMETTVIPAVVVHNIQRIPRKNKLYMAE